MSLPSEVVTGYNLKCWYPKRVNAGTGCLTMTSLLLTVDFLLKNFTNPASTSEALVTLWQETSRPKVVCAPSHVSVVWSSSRRFRVVWLVRSCPRSLLVKSDHCLWPLFDSNTVPDREVHEISWDKLLV